MAPKYKQEKGLKKQTKETLILASIAVVLILLLLGMRMFNKENKEAAVPPVSEKVTQNSIMIELSAEGDLVIPTQDITEQATFYPVEIDDINFEVLAVKAPDGSIRTAFNTCQICYGSGRGYYIQQGEALVCQNCGNRFVTSEVEIVRGGCNPVPIMSEDKVIDEKSITIPNKVLKEASVIFTNWKSTI